MVEIKSITAKKIRFILDQVFALSSLMALGLLIVGFGFELENESNWIISVGTEWVLGLFIVQELIRIFIRPEDVMSHLKSRKIEIFMAVLAGQYFVYVEILGDIFQKIVPGLGSAQISLLYLATSQLFLIFFTVLAHARRHRWFQKLKMDPGQVIILSFLTGAILGTLFLKLPRSSYHAISWSDAAFTAISSICVTGLLPFNLADTFTPLGQFIIVILIQIGGLGIMTLTMVFLTLFPGSLSVKEKIFLSEMVSENRLGEVGVILRRIAISTFTIEAIGAVYLYFTVMDLGDHFDAVVFYHSIFHSVSAFCNAGLTLFTGDYDLLGSNGYTGGLAVLIMFGGIGFPVISEIYNYFDSIIKRKKRPARSIGIATKLVVTTSILLWFGGALLIGLLESNHSFSGTNGIDTAFHSMFFSITSRTAGFSSWPLTSLNSSTLIILMMLMWIGASPISTGGGIKTLNFALIILSLKSHIQGLSSVNVFKRRISDKSILRSYSVVTLITMIAALSMAIIFYLEPHLDALKLAFEVVSAMGTVGLSVDITYKLGEASRVLIMFLMFFGRVGPYTLLLAIYRRKTKVQHRELEEEIQTY